MTRTWARWPQVRVAALAAAVLAAMALAVTVAGAHAAASAAGRPPRVAMILIDDNVSFAGAGIVQERSAALAYTQALPADVRVGVIAFGDRSKLLLAPTTDRALVPPVLASVSPSSQQTSQALQKALNRAAAVIQRQAGAQSRVLVLSDGELMVGQPASAVPADVLYWYYENDDQKASLRALARASGGRCAVPARAAWIARTMFPPLQPVPPPHHHAPGPHPAVAAPHPAPAGRWPLELVLVTMTVFAALLLIALKGFGAITETGRSRSVIDQVSRYGPQHAPAPQQGDGKLADAALRSMERVLRARNAEVGLATRLDLAGIGRKPAEWALLCTCASVILAAALTFLFGNVFLGTVLGIGIGWLCARLLVDILIARRRASFGEQLPNVLQLVAGSLQSGFSLSQALDGVVREDQQPIGGEFARALAEARLGTDIEDALDSVADRMASQDLRWSVIAIRIQREVGGNLAEVLRNTAGTMRERAQLRGHVKALTAEGRLSAYILVALPVAIGGWLFYSSPSYMSLLYTTGLGVAMLLGAAVMVVVGALWMRVLVRVEV